MFSSLQSIVTALQDGVRLRARMIGGMNCVEIRNRGTLSFVTCGASPQNILAALYCTNEILSRKGSCLGGCARVDQHTECLHAFPEADQWLSVDGNSFEISHSMGAFSVVLYQRGATAAPPSSANDLDTAMEMAFPVTALV